jgi:uncharacterized protein YecE (DUF72 family)
MRIRVGTSGYAYKEWKGGFYPEKLADGEMLPAYAAAFPTVEINNTFYRLPSKAVLESWSAAVPEGFVFVLKASRRITHQKRLHNTRELLDYLYGNASVLATKLGPFLFQLPPFLKKDLERLQAFLADLPDDRRIALEFRHASWCDEEVFEVLRRHGVAWCIADDHQGEAPLVATASFGYVRLRGETYREEDLARWLEQIRSQPWTDCFVFFSHEGSSPGLARRLLEMAEQAEPHYKWEPSRRPPEERDREVRPA